MHLESKGNKLLTDKNIFLIKIIISPACLDQNARPEVEASRGGTRPLWGTAFFPRLPSVQFSRSVVSDFFRPHGLKHTRPSCSSPTPGAYSNSCPLRRWYHPTISSSVIPFSSRLQSFLAPGSFLMSQLFTSGGQSIGVPASALVLPMNIQS